MKPFAFIEARSHTPVRYGVEGYGAGTLSQEDLAFRINGLRNPGKDSASGIDQSVISRIENGEQQLTPQIAVLWARACYAPYLVDCYCEEICGLREILNSRAGAENMPLAASMRNLSASMQSMCDDDDDNNDDGGGFPAGKDVRKRLEEILENGKLEDREIRDLVNIICRLMELCRNIRTLRLSVLADPAVSADPPDTAAMHDLLSYVPDNNVISGTIAASKSSKKEIQDRDILSRAQLERLEGRTQTGKKPGPADSAAIGKLAKYLHAPQLINYYCSFLCPIGAELMPVPLLESNSLDRIAYVLQMYLNRLEEVQALLKGVFDDGAVGPGEQAVFDECLQILDRVWFSADSLQLWTSRHLLGKLQGMLKAGTIIPGKEECFRKILDCLEQLGFDAETVKELRQKYLQP